MVSAPSFSQPYLCIQPTLQSPPKTVPLLQSSFTSLFHPYLFTELSLQSPLRFPFFTPQQFSPPFVHVQPTQQSTPKIFSPPWLFRQFRLCQGTRELGSLVRTDTILISSFFLKVWADNHWLFIAETQKTAALQVWQTIQFTIYHTLNLLPLLPYPTNTSTKT